MHIKAGLPPRLPWGTYTPNKNLAILCSAHLANQRFLVKKLSNLCVVHNAPV
jgi:hypothetical protein